MKSFTVAALKEFIKDLPDNIPVLVPGGDHCYYRASFNIAPAEFNKGSWYEYFDDMNMSEGGKKVDEALIIGA
jgi:hypothetical protein